MSQPLPATHYGSAAALAFKGVEELVGVLIEGPSGSGKSSLILDLLTLGSSRALGLEGVRLVGDDQLLLSVDEDGALLARAPERLKGLMEVRGLGLIRLEAMGSVQIGLRVQIVEEAERLPLKQELKSALLNVELATLPLLKSGHMSQIVVLAASAIARGRSLEAFGERGVPFPF